MQSPPPPRREGPARPAGTLYARASLFVVLGSGALLGALVGMSVLIVQDSRDRLLNERFALALAVGELLENQIHADVERLVDVSQVIIEDPTIAADHDDAELLLQAAVRSGSLREGAFVLDHFRRPLVGAPDPPDRVREIDGLEHMLDAVDRRQTLLLSGMGRAGPRPVLAAVAPVRGRRNTIVGYAVGLLQPASSDLLAALRQTSAGRQSDLALLDANGVEIATTDRHQMFERAMREGPVARLVTRCSKIPRFQSCQGEANIRGDMKVLAVAPLPTLGLAVIVVQSEKDALAPAYLLRFRLLALGGSVVVLFIGFNLLSIQSIVRPVRRLTSRVRSAEDREEPFTATGFGHDEVAELAESMRTWQQATLTSRARAEEHQQQEEYLHLTVQAQEDERSRIARDLHDTVAQDLAALRLDAERLAGRVVDPTLRSQLAIFEERAQGMLATVRGILLDLRISIVDGQSFVPALQALLDRARDKGSLQTHLLVDGQEPVELSYHLAIALFRVVQEGLLNVVQHARATHVFVTLRIRDDEVGLTIEDDGEGFDATLPSSGSTPRRTGKGLGILGMKERVHLAGGTFELESQPGEGTTLRVNVPRTAIASLGSGP